MRSVFVGMGVIAAALPAQAMAQHAPTPAPAPAPGAASAAGGEEDPYADQGDIVVTGNRDLPGAVIGDIKPELELGPADVRSYGVSTIADLLTELAPETESGRGSGRPVLLLNGRRISSFSEIRDLPTEAILRVDILPEEVALKYGYSADQKVVNIVLRRRFHSTTLEAIDKLPTEGGSNSPRATLGLLTINPAGRFSLNLDYQQTSPLLESERDLTGTAYNGAYDLAGNITALPGAASDEIDPALSALAGAPVTIAGVPASAASAAPTLGGFAGTANRANVTDQARYRTLQPASHDFSANAVLARTVFGNVQATANGRIEITDSTSDQGLPGVSYVLPAGNPWSPFGNDVLVNRYVGGKPLQQSNQSIDSHLGLTLDGTVKSWRWSVTGDYDRTDSKTFTTTGFDIDALQAALDADDPGVNPFGVLSSPLIAVAPGNHARSTSTTAGMDALANGSLFKLPAGSVSTSVKIGVETNRFDSSSWRDGQAIDGHVARDIVNGRMNIDLPIASRRKGVLAFAGDLSANLNLAADRLSDFGTLTTIGYGVNWSPIDQLRALVSFTDQGDAPTAAQLGNPTIATPNTRVFDYVRGETVDVTRISGGNPNLAADSKHVFKAELNAKPFPKTDLRLNVTYVATRIDDAIADLPSPTAAIEAAFPDRFMRDADGTLTGIDGRPINFDRDDTKELRMGFNLSVPLKSRLQKQVEAYRNGTGANPFAGFRRRREAPQQPEQQQQQSAATGQQADRSAPPGSAPPQDAQGSPPPAPGGDGGRGPGGFGHFGHHGGFGRRGGGGGRLQFAVYHTWRLEDQVHIRPGLPVLDLLNGGTSGSQGGTPRHEVEVQAGYFNNGLGARLSANWQSGTDVEGGSAGNPDTLHFSPLATVNLRLFWDMSANIDFVRKRRWAQGMRIAVSADNLFDQRQRVTDAAGTTPVNYQPDYLDPLGRTIRISIRKLFFQRSAR